MRKLLMVLMLSTNLYAETMYKCSYNFDNKTVTMNESETRYVKGNYYFKFSIKDPQKPNEVDDYVEIRDLTNQRSITYSLKCNLEG